MPEYFQKKYRGYEIDIYPSRWMRRIFRKFPYFIGNRILLDIRFIKKGEYRPRVKNQHTLEKSKVWKIYTDYKKAHGIRDETNYKKEEFTLHVESDPIAYQGEFVIKLGEEYGPEDDLILFSTTVMSKDLLRRDIFLLFIGFIFSLMCGFCLWLLGIIQLVPIWNVLITP